MKYHILIIFILLSVLVACGSAPEATSPPTPTTDVAAEPPTPTPMPLGAGSRYAPALWLAAGVFLVVGGGVVFFLKPKLRGS